MVGVISHTAKTKKTIKLELIKFENFQTKHPSFSGNAKISWSTFQITSMPCYSKNFTKPYLASLSLSLSLREHSNLFAGYSYTLWT